MIVFDRVTISYPDARPIVQDVSFTVEEAELCLVAGVTGTGKTTLLQAINGLVPHFTGGTLGGRVTVAGRSTAETRPRDLADIVGMVMQNPAHGFVTDLVEDELAYGMESIGLPASTMRRRVEEVLDMLGLVDLRDRPLATLSGGQAQRVAIGAVLTSHPAVLVLDEPTSALDPPAAEEVLAVIDRLVHDVGLTVIVAEHRLERVIHLADRMILLGSPEPSGQPSTVTVGSPREIMRDAPIAPPVVHLARLFGWQPLPLSIRDARRHARGLREQVMELPEISANLAPSDAPQEESSALHPVVALDALDVRYGPIIALRGVSCSIAAGEIVAVMGRNGAGKSTLLQAVAGLHQPHAGVVSVLGTNPATLRPRMLVRHVAYVPQDCSDLLFNETVADECAAADGTAGIAPHATWQLLRKLGFDLDPQRHPRDLSEGERLALALAIQLAARAPLILLDEPTRGLDYRAKRQLITVLRTLRDEGHTIMVATHDVEFVAELATRTVILADGEIVIDGPTVAVVSSSPAFAPQVAKVFAPLALATFDDARTLIADVHRIESS